MNVLKGSEFLLDGYIDYDEPYHLTQNGIEYTISYYQKEHQDEYLIKVNGNVYLFKNGVLLMSYQEEQEVPKGNFTRFENGCVSFVQSFDDIYERRDFNRIVNHVKGERMEIFSYDSGIKIYHGEFNEKREREGWGIEYDEKTGSMLLEGLWKKNKLVEIIRKIEGNAMTEFKRNGVNTLVSNRIPVYVGEFLYDESTESFSRNGRGYFIDEETRIAYRECEWRDGKEVNGRDLFDGWYSRSKNPINIPVTAPCIATIKQSTDLDHLELLTTSLEVSANSCNDIKELEFLNKLQYLRSVKIGDDCFGSVKTFELYGLKRLRSLIIGKNSFTQNKNHFGNDSNKSFRVLNCSELESIVIGEYSFSDFAGDVEFKNLPSLQSITIGFVGKPSANFYWSSLSIHGNSCIILVILRSPQIRFYSVRRSVIWFDYIYCYRKYLFVI